MDISNLNKHVGNIDLYLLDQILKGRFHKGMKVLDVGCGEGRNLMYFINERYDVVGIDKDPNAIRMLQFVARSNNPSLEKENFKVETIETTSLNKSAFDLIICNAVLHFAEHEDHFHQMFEKLIELTKQKGILFIRTASSIGIEDKVSHLGNGRYLLGDGSERFLINRDIISELTKRYGITHIEPLKTVNVDDKRCMSTLVLSK